MIISSLVVVIIIVYLILIGALVYGFDKVDDYKLQDLKPKARFSIIIPFRNEAKYLNKLLNSLSQLNYPQSLFEVILVDDDSEDDSIQIINKVLKRNNRLAHIITVIKNDRRTSSPKKDAITSAITTSRYEWIITTDADCILPKFWLDTFDEFIQTQNPNCIVGPVIYNRANSFFNRFQILDFLSLQGATIGGFGLHLPFLCNGANFGYRKSVFKDVDGFYGNNKIASGDDIFLLEKFINHDAKKVGYLKSMKAIVTTNPVSGFRQLIQQRLRWASKTSHTSNWFSKCVGLIVLLGNLACATMIPLLLLDLLSTKIVLSSFIIKFSIDFLLLFKVSRFFNQENVLPSYILSSLIYPFFSVYISLLSFFMSYSWKGRTFRK
ncbi:glycosyltransferase family 2 protein [Winogradskyella sp. PE311]|uniref:glycosyltransferase family 2 protein n=1 Tax=Winogradskyella sp. PE311 TaxID=3366943 RepID=UPI00397F803F